MNGHNRKNRQRYETGVMPASAMAKTDQAGIAKCRHRNRCWRCGRPRAYLRKFGICRLCFRQLALNGEIPGVTKASW